jgi:hypothetical protein
MVSAVFAISILAGCVCEVGLAHCDAFIIPANLTLQPENYLRHGRDRKWFPVGMKP